MWVCGFGIDTQHTYLTLSRHRGKVQCNEHAAPVQAWVERVEIRDIPIKQRASNELVDSDVGGIDALRLVAHYIVRRDTWLDTHLHGDDKELFMPPCSSMIWLKGGCIAQIFTCWPGINLLQLSPGFGEPGPLTACTLNMDWILSQLSPCAWKRGQPRKQKAKETIHRTMLMG